MISCVKRKQVAHFKDIIDCDEVKRLMLSYIQRENNTHLWKPASCDRLDASLSLDDSLKLSHVHIPTNKYQSISYIISYIMFKLTSKNYFTQITQLK